MGTVRVDNKPGIAVITIDNDRRRNAIDIELARRLAAAVEAASADLDVRAVVVTGVVGAKALDESCAAGISVTH